MIMIRAIIFDYGGVVANDVDPKIQKDIASEFGISLSDTKKAMKGLLGRYQTGEINDDIFWKEFSNRTGKPLPQDYRKLWLDRYSKESRIDNTITSLIRNLKSSRYRIALISNTISPHAEYNSKNNRFSLFDVIILSSEVGRRKPDKHIYELALEKLGIDAESCVYIDDRKEHLLPAENLGMHTILYRDISQLEKDLKTLGINIR